MMFVSGRIDLALPRLDEAISLLGGQGAMKSGSNRDRVFNNAMTFAQKLASDDDAKNRQTISGLYDRAAGAASTPMQQVNYRLKRAGSPARSARPTWRFASTRNCCPSPRSGAFR